MRIPVIRISNRSRSDLNLTVQAQKMARGLKFQIQEAEGLSVYEVKTKMLISCAVTAQLICAFVFLMCKKQGFFS